MQPYQQVPIQDCGDRLIPIPLEHFAVVSPHPYQVLGAPYGGHSPHFLRQQVLDKLFRSQALLQQQYPGWRIQLFDAYRPVAVQQFMVNYTFRQIAAEHGADPDKLDDLSYEQRQAIQNQVYQFWASPSDDPATPPPHSTGAALDITLTHAAGGAVDMGSPIDEPSARSFPNHFANSADPTQQAAHQNRQRLYQAMAQAGFCQHPNEWWHFSYGDQLWAWQCRKPTAIYGRI